MRYTEHLKVHMPEREARLSRLPGRSIVTLSTELSTHS